jgi:hypothetical protein
LPTLAIHSLLHDDPSAVIRHDKPMQVKIEAVLHSGAIDLGDKPADFGQPNAVKPDPLADGDQLVRRLPRMPAAAATDMDPQFAPERRETALQCADYAGRDARRVPIHAHHGAERLEPG